MQSSETGLGYSLIGQSGQIYPFGDAASPTNADSVVSAISGEVSASLSSDVTALVNQQAPGNPNGLWIGGDPDYWRSSSGPGLAAAAVAASTGDPTMRADAEQTFDTLISEHEQPNGSFTAAAGAPDPQSPDIDTMFFVDNLGMALWALRPQMSSQEVAAWTSAITAGANYLVNNGNLTWYTNGNVVVGNALVMALAYWATGNPVYETDYQQALSFAISPPQNRWPGFGLIYTKIPTLPDGSDGAAYFAESGGGAPGFDADYTQVQLDQLTRLYLVTSSPQVLRLVNLLMNQEWPLVDTGNLELNTSGGTRHPQARPVHPLHLSWDGVERIRRWPVLPDALSPAAGRSGRIGVLGPHHLLGFGRPVRLRPRSGHLRPARPVFFLSGGARYRRGGSMIDVPSPAGDPHGRRPSVATVSPVMVAPRSPSVHP